MKRRAASSVESLKSDSSKPSNSRSGSSSNIEVAQRAKRKRSGFLGDDSCIENAGTKRRKLRAGVRKRVSRDQEEEEEEENCEQKEILEDMGLNILSDNSNSCDTMQQPHSIRLQVLQAHDPNIITITDSPHLSPLKRPAPPANVPTVTNIDIDAGSSSFIETDGNRNTKQLSIEEEFFQYTNTMKGPNTQVLPVKDFFNRLPEELVLSVFKWLPKCTLAKCARVCKRWLKVTQDESLWRRLDLGLVTVPAGVVGQVLSRGCAVLRLSRATVLQPVFTSSVSGLPTFPLSSQSGSARLQYLDLSMTSISGPCLELLLSHCSMLRNLSMENAEVNDVICSAISANANLSVLHLGGVKGLKENGIRRILRKCRKLIELNVGWTQLSAPSLQVISTLLCPSVRRLCLSGHRDTLTDAHIKDLVESCPNLRDLDVSDSSLLTPASLNTMVEGLTYLESVSTSRCYNITPSSYLMLTACPTLLYLNVFGLLREPALEELKERLQGIEINKFMFTSVARPTVGIKRTSIWNLRVRD